MKKILAVVGEEFAGIGLDTEFMDEPVLRAFCVPCREVVYYEGRKGDGSFGWCCRKCNQNFEPRNAGGTTNYYKIKTGDVRFTAAEWVASWWNIDPKDVDVQWT